MSIRISLDANRPSATIEIPLENPLPDYDLLQLEQPTPRDVDAVLVSQGFRDLVDDARGVLMDLLAHPPYQASSPEHANLRSEEHTSELQSRLHLVCRLLLEKKKNSNVQPSWTKYVS